MPTHALRKCLLLLALASWSLPAQDQKVVVTGAFHAVSGLSDKAISQAVLTEADAQLVIQSALHIAAPEAAVYYLIHALTYQAGSKSGSVGDQNWYVYYQPWLRRGWLQRAVDPRLAKHFAEARLYGGARVAMVYVHVVTGTSRAMAAIDGSARLQLPPRNAGESDADYIRRIVDTTRADFARLSPIISINRSAANRQQLLMIRKALAAARGATDWYGLETPEMPAVDDTEALRAAAADVPRVISEPQACPALPAQCQVDLSGATEQFLAIRRAVIATHATDATGSPFGPDSRLISQLRFIFHEPGATDQLLPVPDVQSMELHPVDRFLVQKPQSDVLAGVAYEIAITKVVPAPEQNLNAIVGLALGANAGAAKQAPTQTVPIAFAAGGDPFQVLHLPSKMEVSGRSEQQDENGNPTTSELGKNTYQNEKKYWYDFSLALPLQSYNEFRYDQTSNQITAAKIDKKNVWAFLNLGVPRDTSHMEAQYIPTFLYGIPITSQPLHHHIFGGAVGLNLVNVFFGVRLDRKPFDLDFSKPLTGNNVEQKWRTHFTYGINFPVGTIVKALGKKAGSSN
jgi:hypothetical protein